MRNKNKYSVDYDWIANEHIENLRLIDVELDSETKHFIYELYDASKESAGKDLFYQAVYLLKRSFLPQIIIYWILIIKTKKAFREHASAKALIGLEKVFAKTTLQGAIKRYCKLE